MRNHRKEKGLLWRVAEMATKNAMFIGQPHTQRHLWTEEKRLKIREREVDSSKSLANSNTCNKLKHFLDKVLMLKTPRG